MAFGPRPHATDAHFSNVTEVERKVRKWVRCWISAITFTKESSEEGYVDIKSEGEISFYL